MDIAKEECEREIFRQYATAAGLLSGGSFESRTPPEPDILFAPTPGVGSLLAFELVEIVDEGYSGTCGNLLKAKCLCAEYFSSLSKSKHDKFERSFGDADISFALKCGMTNARFRGVLSKIFDGLMKLPPHVVGDINVHDIGIGHILNTLSVGRGSFKGPLFNCTSGVWASDPVVNAITRKMQKSYRPQGELNLLAYIDGDSMLPEDVWLPELDDYLETLDACCQFANIYVFKCKSKSILRHWRRNAKR